MNGNGRCGRRRDVGFDTGRAGGGGRSRAGISTSGRGRLGANSGRTGRGDRRGSLRNRGGAGVGSRTGEVVGRERLVDVNDDAVSLGRVQFRAQGTLGLVGARTGDLEVEALRVILRTTLCTSTAHCHQLMTQGRSYPEQ